MIMMINIDRLASDSVFCYLAHKCVFENREERQQTVKTELEKFKIKWRGRLRRADGCRDFARGASYSLKTLKERDGLRVEMLTTHQLFLSSASEMWREEHGVVLTPITNTVPCQLTSQQPQLTHWILQSIKCFSTFSCGFTENIILLPANLKMCRFLSCVGLASGGKFHAFFDIVRAFIPLVYDAFYRPITAGWVS